MNSLFERHKKVDAYLWRDSMDKGTSLHYCIRENKLSLFKKILDNEPKINNLLGQSIINIPDEGGRTPLHEAILMNKKKFVDVLIQKKCDINIVDNEGKSAYHYALIADYKKLQLEKLSPYILCKINNQKCLVGVTDTLNDMFIQNINSKCKEYKINNVKLYFNKKEFLKEEINHHLYLGEKESVPKSAKFINYL